MAAIVPWCRRWVRPSSTLVFDRGGIFPVTLSPSSNLVPPPRAFKLPRVCPRVFLPPRVHPPRRAVPTCGNHSATVARVHRRSRNPRSLRSPRSHRVRLVSRDCVNGNGLHVVNRFPDSDRGFATGAGLYRASVPQRVEQRRAEIASPSASVAARESDPRGGLLSLVTSIERLESPTPTIER